MAFHANDGLLFTRKDDGSVWVEKRVPCITLGEEYNGDFAIVERWRLDEGTWSSVVASMSAYGEDGRSFREAQRFHTGGAICGVTSASGAKGEMLGCGFQRGHDGPHAWATLPTFPLDGDTAR